MEYADQNLADLLQRRALTQEEAWELLLPTVDALAFLHRRHLVHGHLKPSNILVVGDTVKLSSDRIRAAAEVARSNGRRSVYDSPEADGGTASDIWAFGVTLAEGLTRAYPSGAFEPGKEVIISRDFPPAFADAVRRCMSYEPNERPSATDLKDWIKDATQQPVVSIPPASDVATLREPAVTTAAGRPGMQGLPGNAESQKPAPRRRSLAFLIAGSVVILLICWAAVRVLGGPDLGPPTAVAPAPAAPAAQPIALTPEAAPKPPEVAPEPSEAAPQPSDAPAPIEETKEPSQTASPVPQTDAAGVKVVRTPTVLYRDIPKVPHAAREAIRGEVQVIVRVTVDSSGAVVREVLADPGSSTYFAQLAISAAKNWKFAQANDQPSRQWLVGFVFSRDGTAAHTLPLRFKRTAMSH
jgi:hypothetical protein